MEPGQPANPASLPGRRRTHFFLPTSTGRAGPHTFPPVRLLPGVPQLLDTTTVPPPETSRPSRDEERQEGGVMFIREYFLAKSLVSFSPGLIFSSRPTSGSSRVADHCGSRPQPVTPSRGGGPAALFSVNRSAVRSHFRPYGACPLRECLVYTPFIYGALVCVS